MTVIGVFGATGRTGGATVRALRRRGAGVRALVRRTDGKEAAELLALGAEVVRADQEDMDSLNSALAGCERVFNVQAAFDSRGRHQYEAEVRQGKNVARAAAAAGVRHVVQISAGPGHRMGLPHFDAKIEIREAMERAGLRVTALHPGPFMELMVDPRFAPAISTWGAEPRMVGWERPMPWIAVSDVGQVAAERLLAPVPAESSAEMLVGDYRSLQDCRALLASRGRKPFRLPMPLWLFRAMAGTELPDMWHYLMNEPRLPVTAGRFLDVPAWVKQL